MMRPDTSRRTTIILPRQPYSDRTGTLCNTDKKERGWMEGRRRNLRNASHIINMIAQCDEQVEE